MTAPVLVGYFEFPFATSGDGAPIPNTSQVDGSISYPIGYGPDYELNLLTNPAAQPIGRLTMNQLFFEITSQLQLYSQYGTPLFITSAQNGGSPFPYPINARVYYTDNNVYENQVPGNTVLPGVDDSWLKVSGDATGVPVGAMLDFGGTTAPAGYLLTDGSAVSRASYGALLSAITQAQTGTTVNTVNTVTGLSSTSQLYYGCPLEAANFPAGSYVWTITSSSSITVGSGPLGSTVASNATASGSVAINFFNWGNGDGSTTFNVPLRTGRASAGSGGTLLSNPSSQPDAVGQKTGVASYTLAPNDLPAHTHPASSGGFYISTAGGLNYLGGSQNFSESANTGPNATANNPISLLQPTVICYNIIKT